MGYASKYYDPVKAHEYYEKHKKQTARTSTKGMNASQKEMAAYVKDRLMAEKKAKNQEVSDRHNSQAKEQRQAFTDSCNEKVKALREKLKGMSKEEKAAIKDQIAEEINSIKEQFKNLKSGVTQEHSKGRKAEKAANQQDYSNKYAEALQEIRKRK